MKFIRFFLSIPLGLLSLILTPSIIELLIELTIQNQIDVDSLLFQILTGYFSIGVFVLVSYLMLPEKTSKFINAILLVALLVCFLTSYLFLESIIESIKDYNNEYFKSVGFKNLVRVVFSYLALVQNYYALKNSYLIINT